MIEIEELSKHYGNLKAVDGVSFEVKKGEILGLLGPNGAGKTTIMRIITGFLSATSGKVKVAGLDVFENSIEVKRQIGYLPENVPLYNEMTVNTYLNFVAEIKEVKKKKRKEIVEEIIKKINITEVKNRLIGHISKGYRQRVGLAQALLHEPEILVLDEPTIGLDPRQIIEIRELIKNLKGEKTIILSSHILPEVSTTCERVVIINKGKIVAIDTQEELSKRLQNVRIISIEIKGPEDKIKDKIEKIKGVKEISIKGKLNTKNRFEIQCEKALDIREELFNIMAENHWPILELKVLEMSLEEVFLKLTKQEEEKR